MCVWGVDMSCYSDIVVLLSTIWDHISNERSPAFDELGEMLS